MIGRAPGFKFASDYRSAEDALAGLPKVKPDVVLMDINLPGMNGVECVRQLKTLVPATEVMMLTVYEDTENIFNALAAGASGYMLKRTSSKELIEAIHEVKRGGSPMTTHIARKVAQSFQKSSGQQRAADELSELSEREQQVLDLLSQGLIYKEIAWINSRNQLRNRPHLHPPHLREASGPHPGPRPSRNFFGKLAPPAGSILKITPPRRATLE